MEMRSPRGETTLPLGPRPAGQIVYTKGGRVSVQTMRGDRSAFRSSDMHAGSPDEVRAAFEGYSASFGRYTVSPDDSSVIHHIEGSLFPNWVGGEQRRLVHLAGRRLRLTTPPLLYDGVEQTVVSTWERVE